jgi:putative ABC transport system ATP-binding protein
MSLQITNLGKHYGDVAVFTNVSLTVAAGEFVAIVGESGVGKSTLLNCMAGLDSWDSGTVSLAGTNLGTLDDDARAASMWASFFRPFTCCRTWMWRKTWPCR